MVVECSETGIADGAAYSAEVVAIAAGRIEDRVNDEMLVAAGTKGDALILVRVDAAVVDGSDGVLHSCASFHFTILIDVLLMSSIPFLDLGTRYESLIVMTTMYGGTFKIHYLTVYYI